VFYELTNRDKNKTIT